MKFPGTVVLTPEDMKEIYKAPVEKMVAMLQGALNDMRQRGLRPFDTVALFGGGASEFVQQQIQEACKPTGGLGVSCDVRIIRPTDASFMAAAAVGGIYVQEDEAILDERVTLRGYYISRHILADNILDYDSDDTDQNLEISEHDQQVRRTDVSKCLIQPGTTVGRRHVARVRGERALLSTDRDDDGNWDHQEDLYYSDEIVEDDTWVLRPELSDTLKKMDNPLEFQITAEMARGYPVEWDRDRTKSWHIIDFEIRLILEKNELIFQLVVPHTGKFVIEGIQDEGVTVISGKYNVAGNFCLLAGRQE